MRHYFAYGSNMDRAHMAQLCPQAEALGPARLDNHRFFIAHGGYGSIAPKRGAAVHGVLWRITARDRVALEAYEQIGDGLYQHATLPVHVGDKLLRALVYVANDARPARPSAKYCEFVLAAARHWNFPDDYARALEREMMSAP
ncbi:MAG: gamma-glutamylcyclotransferase family protein [Xanthobacteraceae bacterium]